FASDPSRSWLNVPISVPSAAKPNHTIAVAAALGVNIDLTGAHARIEGSGNLTAGSIVLVHGSSDVDASATANARAVDNSLTGYGVAAAVAINVAGPSTEAMIAGQATAAGITVITRMSGDLQHTYTADAASGAGANANALAGALAINVAVASSEARVDGGAVLTLTSGGSLLIDAASKTDNEADAHSKVAGPPAGRVRAAV